MENGSDVDDPFASKIRRHCRRPSSSQEEKLRFCPFSGDTESSSASDEASDRAIEIRMVSGGNDTEELQNTVGLAKRSPAALVDYDDDIETLDNTADQIGAENGFGKRETEKVNGDTVVLEAEPSVNAHEVFVEMPTREQEVSVNTGKHIKKNIGDIDKSVNTGKHIKKNIGDIDKFRYVGTKSKRDLPSSLKDQEKRKGTSNYSRHKDFVGVLDHALKLIVAASRDSGSENEKDDDCDFLETAKRRGMTFPRPRWWPPEGFQD